MSKAADHIVYDQRGFLHARRAETQRLVGRHHFAVLLAAQDEFVFKRCLHNDAARCRTSDHALQEGARAGGPRLSVEGQQVGGHGRRAGDKGQDLEGGRVGHDADFADRPHSLEGLELVEHGEGLHRHRQAHAALQPAGQTVDVRELAPDDAPVVAVKKTNQPQVGFACFFTNLFGCHRSP